VGDLVSGTRRALLAGVGAAGAAVTVTGCGGDRGRPTGAATPAAGAAPAATSSAGISIRTTDIPVDGGRIFPELGPDGTVVTQPTAGLFHAFSATCTHRGCLLASISDGAINCPCHGARYSMLDGSVIRPGDGLATPTRALARKNVTVADGTITVT
jgi:Rieske Fe-S protein